MIVSFAKIFQFKVLTKQVIFLSVSNLLPWESPRRWWFFLKCHCDFTTAVSLGGHPRSLVQRIYSCFLMGVARLKRNVFLSKIHTKGLMGNCSHRQWNIGNLFDCEGGQKIGWEPVTCSSWKAVVMPLSFSITYKYMHIFYSYKQ